MTNIRFLLAACALVALAACQPAAPEDSRFGVGFDQTFEAQQANRNAALTGGNLPAAPTVSAQSLPPAGSAEETAAQTSALLAQTSAGQTPDTSAGALTVADAARLEAAANNSGVAPLEASPSNPPPAVIDSATGISRENSFDAVSGQRSIESDAARLAANRAQYQVIQPTALPQRTATGPNIVEYALSTNHAVGTRKYRRSSFNARNRSERACARFGSADQAQIAFLQAGGPQRDRAGMDPDGDGYACRWNPAVFRNIRG
jgi:hypothetical protein